MMKQGIVIDCGTGLSKAGLSGQDAPRCKFPTIVGTPKAPTIMVGMKQKESYVGDDAQSKSKVLNFHNPIIDGIIDNWGDMIEVLRHIYYSELRVTPEQHPCLLTQSTFLSNFYIVPKNPIKNRHRITEVMFESFDVPHFYLANQAVLSLFATGRTTGLALDCGSGVTNAVPVYEGYAAPHAIKTGPFAGKSIDKFLLERLEQKGIKLNKNQDIQELEAIKQGSTCCSTRQQYQDLKNSANASSEAENIVQLPDGQQINIGRVGHDCGQLLFDPSSFGYTEQLSLSDLIHGAIQECDNDVKKDLFNSVITSGGISNIRNFGTRLQNEVVEMYPQNQVVVEEKQHREFLAWLGGSILSNLPTFQSMWVSRAEYQENGVSIIDKKCF